MDYEKKAQEMLDLKQYDEAINILNEAIELQPRKDEYYYLRGEAKHCLKEYEDAIIDYDIAIELSKNHSQ